MREVVAAVDVGGTRIKAALVDRSYDVAAAVTVPTSPDIAADVGATVQSAVADLLARVEPSAGPVRLAACGVVVPGLVDERRGVGVWSANLGWRDLPVGDAVTTRLQVPTAVGHDVRAGLLAESRLGAARGARHALFLPVGTGIAGALMLEGVLVSADGWAGELGHMVIDPAGLPCACGAVGCLETIGSAAAVERAFAAQAGERRTAEQVAALVATGDPVATLVWQGAVSALGAAIAATVTLTGVDLVLVGGGLAESGETAPGAAAGGHRRPADLPAPTARAEGRPRRPGRLPRRRVPGVGCPVIITVTLNAALDITYDVAELVPHASHRVTAVRQRAGGKGVNVASVLARMGRAVIATGYAGGRTGADICADLAARGIAHRFVDGGGDARRTVTVVSQLHGDATLFNEPGPLVPAAAWTSLLDTLGELVRDAPRRGRGGLGQPAPGTSGRRLLAAGRSGPRVRRPGGGRRRRRGAARCGHGRTGRGQAQPRRAAGGHRLRRHCRRRRRAEVRRRPRRGRLRRGRRPAGLPARRTRLPCPAVGTVDR